MVGKASLWYAERVVCGARTGAMHGGETRRLLPKHDTGISTNRSSGGV